MNYDIFKERLGDKAFNAFGKIMSFVDCNYNMNVLYDGKDEVKLKRSNTLVTLYIDEGKIRVLIIFGKKEREVFEKVSSSFSKSINDYYNNSKTYHDGKWMFIDVYDDTYLMDIIEMIKIKKKTNPNVLTMCGYKCDLCKAYVKNIKKDDRRTELSRVWKKYYDIDIKAEDIYCDGCRCKKSDAKRIDADCPVRACVIDKKLHSCIDCSEYPCEKFLKREGLCCEAAKQKLGEDFSESEYNEFSLAYDNKSRIDEYLKIIDLNKT